MRLRLLKQRIIKLTLITSISLISSQLSFSQITFESIDTTISFDYVDNSVYLFEKIVSEKDSTLLRSTLPLLFDSDKNISLIKFRSFYIENLSSIDSLDFNNNSHFVELKIPIKIEHEIDSVNVSFIYKNEFWKIEKVQIENLIFLQESEMLFSYLELEKKFSTLIDSISHSKTDFLFENSLEIDISDKITLLEDFGSYLVSLTYKVGGIIFYLKNKPAITLTLEYEHDSELTRDWKLTRIVLDDI